jgi:hypothetical protein
VCSAARDNEASAHRAAIVASITLNTSPASSYSSYLPNEHTTPPAEDEALSIFGQRKRATERVAEILARARELQQQDVCKSLFMAREFFCTIVGQLALLSPISPLFFLSLCLSLALSHVSLQQLLGSLSLVRSVERIDPMNPAALALHADDCVCVRLPQCVPVWRKYPLRLYPMRMFNSKRAQRSYSLRFAMLFLWQAALAAQLKCANMRRKVRPSGWS